MNEFLRKNKTLLNLYCSIATVLGWALLAVAAILVVAFVYDSVTAEGSHMYLLKHVYGIVLSFTLMGILALGFRQFVEYVYRSEYKPRWILRHASPILYCYAIVTIVRGIVDLYVTIALTGVRYEAAMIVMLPTRVLPAVVYALILCGLGKIVQRVMPAIDESKTLV